MKRRIVYVLFDFHKSQDVDDFERSLRTLINQKKLPSVASLKLMVDHKNLRQINIRDLPIPIVITPDEIEDNKD